MIAPKWRRLLNCAVDSGCVVFLFMALLRLLPTGLLRIEYYRFAVVAVMFSYYAVAEVVFKRTLGKVLTHTYIVTTDEETPSRATLLLRTALRFLPLEPLSLVFSPRALAWHDRFSKTKVIYLDY